MESNKYMAENSAALIREQRLPSMSFEDSKGIEGDDGVQRHKMQQGSSRQWLTYDSS